MKLHRAADRIWTATDLPGVERCLFRTHPEGGRTSVVRLRAGSLFPRHRHEAGEDVLVLEGGVKIGGFELGPGDHLYTAPGEEHDVRALSDAILFVSSPGPTPRAD